MAFQIGDRVVYGIHGVCEIVDFTKEVIDKKVKNYYVLESLSQGGIRIFFPADNPAALEKLRPLLSVEGLHQLLDSDEVCRNCWIEDENMRKQKFKELISGGDRVSLLQMIHTLLEHKKSQKALGRKLHLCDENFLSDAMRLMDSEFSIILNIPHEEVGPYILDRLCK